jgi:hypothetical protein
MLSNNVIKDLGSLVVKKTNLPIIVCQKCMAKKVLYPFMSLGVVDKKLRHTIIKTMNTYIKL